MPDGDAEPPKPKQQTLSITIRDKKVLRAAYMPFLKQGGLFIPTKKKFDIGQELPIQLSLLEDEEKYLVTGEVCWITYEGAQGNRAPGIGVLFLGKEGSVIRNKIEQHLATLLQSDDSTHSM